MRIESVNVLLVCGQSMARDLRVNHKIVGNNRDWQSRITKKQITSTNNTTIFLQSDNVTMPLIPTGSYINASAALSTIEEVLLVRLCYEEEQFLLALILSCGGSNESQQSTHHGRLCSIIRQSEWRIWLFLEGLEAGCFLLFHAFVGQSFDLQVLQHFLPFCYLFW